MSAATFFIVPGRPGPSACRSTSPRSGADASAGSYPASRSWRPAPRASAQPMSLRCEPAALVVRQPEALALQLLSEDVVLLYEILDDALLLAINPSSERHEQQP